MTSESAVSFRDVSVTFGQHEILKQISFEIEQGQFVAVMGPNGAGKTTLLKSILGLVQPTSGDIKLYDSTPAKTPANEIVYVPQIKTLDRSFPAKAIELVVSGEFRAWPSWNKKATRDRALDALKKVGADHLAENPISTLSGGELQRIYLARCFLRLPRLVLLDEPATGIDIQGEADLYDFLEKYQEERSATVMMITHDWEAAFHHCSRILLLNRELISFATPEETVSDDCLRKAFGHVGHAHAMHVGQHHHHE